MAQETIDAIRQTETAVGAAEEETVRGAEAVVAEAETQATRVKAEMTKSAGEGTVRTEEDAKARSERMMQTAGAEEDKDLEALQKTITEKQQKVVEVILSELLQEGRRLRLAIVPMKRVLICGLKKDRKDTLEPLQRQGILEVSNVLQEDDMLGKMDVTSSKTIFERNANIAGQAINILDRYTSEEKDMLSSFEGREVLSLDGYGANTGEHDGVMKRTYRSQELIRRIGEYNAAVLKLEQRIEALVPWRSFGLSLDFKGTKKTAASTGSIQDEITLEQAAEQLKELAPQAEAIDVAIVSMSKEQTCLFIVCAKVNAETMEDALKKMNFVKPPLSSAVPVKRQQQLEEELTKERAEIGRTEKAMAETTPDRELIKFVMDYYTMRAGKYGVLSDLAQSGRVFFITGYVPEDATPELEKLLQEKYEVVVEYTESGDEEDVPILLHSNKFAEPVEGVIESYSVPSKGEIGPSVIVALFYYIQFGLIFSDAAYGLIMVAGTACCLTKFKNMEAGMKKFIKVFIYCGISATFQGLMFGDFFGGAVGIIATTFSNRPDIRLAPLWFEPASLPMKLLVFVFGLGILHLFIRLGIKFYSRMKNNNLVGDIYDAIFWYVPVDGGIVYLLTMPMFTEMLGLTFTFLVVTDTVTAYAAAVGFVGIVPTSGRESKNWVKRTLKGPYKACGINSYLNDILSYSRLLALGLTISIIPTVFDKMGSMMGDSAPGAITFILVFLIGHSLDLAINALGAYVHTSHPQYVEFFGKFYEDGRRKFEPFAVHTKYYKVKEDV